MDTAALSNASVRLLTAGLRHACKVSYRMTFLLWAAVFRVHWPSEALLAPPSELCQVPDSASSALREALDAVARLPAWSSCDVFQSMLPQCADAQEVRKNLYDPLLSLCLDLHLEVCTIQRGPKNTCTAGYLSFGPMAQCVVHALRSQKT